MSDFIDVLMFAAVLGLLAGVLWFIKLLNDVDQTKIDKYCKQGFSSIVKAKSISDKLPSDYSWLTALTHDMPPNDVPINFKFNC